MCNGSTIQQELLELMRRAHSYRELLELTAPQPRLRTAVSALSLTELFSLWWRGKYASG